MHYRCTGLDPQPFLPLFGLSDEALAERRIRRDIADAAGTYPCRVSLAHAAPGESLLLLNFEHQPADSPYRARGPIYVRERSLPRFDAAGVVPEILITRPLSIRAYDATGMIVDADVHEGRAFEEAVTRYFTQPSVAYLHVHLARRGCYACRVDRA